MDKKDWNFKINGFSNLNEGEYTNNSLSSIENTIRYQVEKEINLQEKIDEIKF